MGGVASASHSSGLPLSSNKACIVVEATPDGSCFPPAFSAPVGAIRAKTATLLDAARQGRAQHGAADFPTGHCMITGLSEAVTYQYPLTPAQLTYWISAKRSSLVSRYLPFAIDWMWPAVIAGLAKRSSHLANYNLRATTVHTLPRKYLIACKKYTPTSKMGF